MVEYTIYWAKGVHIPMRVFQRLYLVLAAAVLTLFLTVPGTASADTEIKVRIDTPGYSGKVIYEDAAVGATSVVPTVSFGDNRALGTLRVTGKSVEGVSVKQGDRITAVLLEGACYMKAPDAENFGSYVKWPESVDGVKNTIQSARFITGTPRSITVEIDRADSSGGTVALDFLYNKENYSAVRVAPLVQKAGQYAADPEGKVTRAEFIDLLADNTFLFSSCPFEFIVSAKGIEESFSDTAGMLSGEKGNAEILAESGLLAGYEGGLLKPDKYITRAEAAHMAGLVFPKSGGKAAFKDQLPDWAAGIHSAADRGIVVGYPDGTFRPDDFITRQEVIILLQRMIESYVIKEN